MNKKGQILDYPIITFIGIIIGLLILAPVMLKIMNSIQAPLSSQLGNITGGGGLIAQENFNSVMTVAINFWDKVIIVAFIVAILLLFVSAFLITAHPLFIILYIIINFMVILFAPNIVDSLSKLYDSPQFATEVAMLSFIDSLRTNFAIFILGIMVITGIIIYGKVAIFGTGGNRK